MQSHRLTQIVWISLISVSISMVFFVAKGWAWDSVQTSLLSTFCIFLLCLWLIQHRKGQHATTLFIVTLTLLASSLIYQAEGLHDEAVVIFPAILLFACMFGTRLQFFSLLAGLIGFLTYIVLAHEQGWHLIPDKVETNFSVLINVSLILIASGFFAFVLSSDLRKALLELNQSKNDLLELNDQLENRVLQRTEQYENANKELQFSMEKLEHAMTELVQAEKLASLGSMVAGISHELNTPIGNTLLAATSMEKLFENMAEKMQGGNLKRVAFADFVKDGLEMSGLITRSTHKAADLVLSFKQVAVDQTSEQRRDFDLKSVVNDNLSAMQPNFKKKEITVNNRVPEGILCNSFPGPLGQILTNLIQNAILHGFADRSFGTIDIQSINQENQVILRIHDDGVGMPQTVITRVFDPFFTTKLGKGGSGLGLSISRRIATSILGGELRVESSPEGGSTFFIVLPKTAPFPL